MEARPVFADVGALLRAWNPREPVYCIHTQACRDGARRFVNQFPGRVLYAVKANDDPDILRLLHEGGVRHFDCASLGEIENVRQHCPESRAYFMTPVRLRGAARTAHDTFDVRHFMVDDQGGLDLLAREIEPRGKVVFVRMAVEHPGAMQNFSNKFGARPESVPGILEAVAATGAEPALAFNVGSSVVTADAYTDALARAARVMNEYDRPLRLVDIGGGFPLAYPGFDVPPLSAFFAAISEAVKALPMTPDGELMAEPGRALAGPALSAVVEVLLRKEQRVYINDGMYGIFWELRFKGHERFPVSAWRDGQPLKGPLQSFRLFGPTCDGSDVLPGEVLLPQDLRPGDYLHFERLGAYSLAGRTHFNAHYSDRIVRLE